MDRYALPRAKRLVVRLIALVFFGLAALQVAEVPLSLVAPSAIASIWNVGNGLNGDPEALLPEPARFRLANDPAAAARFRVRIEDQRVRLPHFLLAMAIDLPVIVILAGMGMALWRSTRLVADAVEQGLRWLMAVGWACIAVATTLPIFDGLRTALLLRGVMLAPAYFWYDPDTAGTSYILLLIAAGILAATWTISAGLRARADIAEIV